MNLRVDHPELLWLLLLIGPVVWRGWTHLRVVEPWRRGLALGLRAAVLIVLVLMLAGLRAQREHTDLTVMAVVDQSPSMRVFADPAGLQGSPESATANRSFAAAVGDYLTVAATDGRQPDDRLGLVTYDERPTVRLRPGGGVTLDLTTDSLAREGTQTARAIEWAMAAKADGNTALRLVLVSDGNDTAGDTLAAARAAAAAGVVIDVLPAAYRVGPEVMVEGVFAPVEAREGQTVAVRVVLRGTAPSRGTLQLQHDGRLLDLNGPGPGVGLPISASDWSDTHALVDDTPVEGGTAADQAEAQDAAGRYVLAKQVDVPLAQTGPNRFEAIFEPAPAPAPGSAPAPGTAAASGTAAADKAGGWPSPGFGDQGAFPGVGAFPGGATRMRLTTERSR